MSAAYLHEQYDTSYFVYVQQHSKLEGTYAHQHKYGRLIGNPSGTPSASYIYCNALRMFLRANRYESSLRNENLLLKTTNTEFLICGTSMDTFFATATHQKLIYSFFHTFSSKYKIKRLSPEQSTSLGSIAGLKMETLKFFSYTEYMIFSTRRTEQNATRNPGPALNSKASFSSGTNPNLIPKDKDMFQQILGEIRYLADSTRPDITFATNILVRCMHTPTIDDHHKLEWLLCFLLGTRTHGKLHRNSPTSEDPLCSFSDADFSNTKNRRSTTGTFHTHLLSPVHWFSQKQSVFALSTFEAECLVASYTVQKSDWLRRILCAIGG